MTTTPGLLTYNIPLVIGWNLVSFNIHPTSTVVTDVLAPVAGNYSLVYAWDSTGSGAWKKYDPSAPPYANTLASLDETIGFWIRMTTGNTLGVTGTSQATSNLALNTGWNLVGFPSSGTLVLPDALSSNGVGTDFTLVYAYHASDTADVWKLYDRTAPSYSNDLLQMSPGWGYWVKLTAPHTWNVSY